MAAKYKENWQIFCVNKITILNIFIIQNFTCHLGRDYDYENYLIWAGNYHPYDSNKLYESKISGAVTEIKNSTLKTSLRNDDEDLWAYTCSSDATGQGKTYSLSYENI